MKRNIYPVYNPFSELLAFPFIINNVIKGKTIKERLHEIIESAKNQACSNLTEKDKYVKQIDFDDLENFFANHFKALENSKVHSFDDKIDYCLDKYAKEAKSLLSAANTVVLEENFLKGAKKTLGIYYLLEKYNTDSNITEIEDVTPKSIGINKNVTNVVQTDETNCSVIGSEKIISNLNNSLKLKELFIDKDLFDKIDFTLLKYFNIIYKRNSEKLEFVSPGNLTDILLLIFFLAKTRYIELDVKKRGYQKIVKSIFEDLDLSVDNAQITRIKKQVFDNEFTEINKNKYTDISLFISDLKNKLK